MAGGECSLGHAEFEMLLVIQVEVFCKLLDM